MKNQEINQKYKDDTYSEQAKTLKNLLDLDKEPISVTFTIEEANGIQNKEIQICNALKNAASGESFIIDTEHSVCPGGSWHCGLVEAPAAENKRMVQKVLTKGEKLYHSIVAFERSQTLITPEPAELAEKIVITPLESAQIRPDIVIFLCNPEQACRILTLDTYWEGIPPKIQMTGALCHSAISYSIMTGSTNLTVGDWTARHHQKFESDIVFVTVPFERIDNLIAAIPECAAGTAKLIMPEELIS